MVAVNPASAIEGFLTLLEQDLASGRLVSTLPKGLEEAMLAAIQLPVEPGQDVEGDVAK